MKNLLVILSSITITVVAIILNFNSILKGSMATTLNFVTTLVYLCVWVAVMILGYRSKERKPLPYLIIFWSITFGVSLLTLFINTTNIDLPFAIPFVIAFITPLYGIRLLNHSFVICSVIYLIISALFITIGLILNKRKNSIYHGNRENRELKKGIDKMNIEDIE